MAAAPLPINVAGGSPARRELADVAATAAAQRDHALRKLCLDYAAKAAEQRGEPDADTIIKDAEKFLAFLSANPLREQ